MTTDKNKVSELNLSERIGDAAYHLEQVKEGPTLLMLDSWDAQATNMEAEITRLRQERDELVGALRNYWADRTGSDKLCGHEYDCICASDLVREVLSKHKPE